MTEQLLPFGKLRLTESDLIFSTHASEQTSDNCVLGVGLLTAVNSIHASSAQVFLRLSSVFPVWAYRVKINHWPFLHVAR